MGALRPEVHDDDPPFGRVLGGERVEALGLPLGRLGLAVRLPDPDVMEALAVVRPVDSVARHLEQLRVRRTLHRVRDRQVEHALLPVIHEVIHVGGRRRPKTDPEQVAEALHALLNALDENAVVEHGG